MAVVPVMTLYADFRSRTTEELQTTMKLCDMCGIYIQYHYHFGPGYYV